MLEKCEEQLQPAVVPSLSAPTGGFCVLCPTQQFHFAPKCSRRTANSSKTLLGEIQTNGGFGGHVGENVNI